MLERIVNWLSRLPTQSRPVNTASTDLLFGLLELRESFNSADLSLRIEDQGWVRLGAQLVGDIDAATRTRLVQLARIYYHRDPLAKQVVRLWTDYAIGNGVNFKCAEAGMQTVLDAFWKNPLNRGLFSAQGIRKSSHRLLVDGEVFLALAGDPPTVVVRRIDPLEITRLLTDPEDSERVVFFRRDYQDATGGNVRTDYYRAWDVEEPLPKMPDDGVLVDGRETAGIVVYPILMDPYRNLFGYVTQDHSLDVDIDWPPIIESDVAKQTAAIAQVIQAIPAAAELPEVQMQALIALGINDVQNVLAKLEKISAEIRKRQSDQIQTQPAPNSNSSAAALLDAIQDFRQSVYP